MQQQSDPKDPDRAPPGPATHQSNSTAKDGSPRPDEEEPDPDRAPPGPATHQSNSTAKDGSPRPNDDV